MKKKQLVNQVETLARRIVWLKRERRELRDRCNELAEIHANLLVERDAADTLLDAAMKQLVER